jgi:hypothetical protein
LAVVGFAEEANADGGGQLEGAALGLVLLPGVKGALVIAEAAASDALSGEESTNTRRSGVSKRKTSGSPPVCSIWWIDAR